MLRGIFYGWFMLPVLVLVNVATAPGQTFGVSAFVPTWIHDLGLSRTQIGGAYMLGTALAAVPMYFVGAAIDRWGARVILTIVVCLFAGACWGISFAESLVTLGIGFFFLRMLGQGSMTLIASYTMAQWFNRRLGRVVGFTSVAVFGVFAFIPGMNLNLIAAHGWRWAYSAWGVFMVAILLPIVFVAFRGRPEDVGQRPDGLRERRRRVRPKLLGMSLAQAAGKRAYWIGMSLTVYWSMTITAIMFVLVDHYADGGFSSDEADMAFRFFWLTLAASTILGGFLADVAPLNRLMSFSAGGLGVATVVFGLMETPAHGWTALGIMALSQGISMATGAALWVRYFGRLHLGKIRGTIFTAMVAGSSLGPPLVGMARDFYGSYDSVFVGLGILGLPFAVLALWATKPRQSHRSGEQ